MSGGTPCYMSPEVLRKAPYGVKADVFSLAVCLLELVLGRYPFENDKRSTHTFEDAIMRGDRPDVPADCQPGIA
jgi:serine/threonine protein kinase